MDNLESAREDEASQPLLSDDAENPISHLKAADGSQEISKPTTIQTAAYMPGKRSVTALQLTVMIYFFTSGGPFGIEPAVGAAGPFLTLIALIAIPLFWSLPQALMAAELSLLIPENGGNIVWVQYAFGDFIGWVNAFNNVASNISSLACLAVLFVDYLPVTLSPLNNWLVKIAFSIANTLLNIGGPRWISRISVVLLVFVLSPFFVEIALVIIDGKLDIHALRKIPPTSDIHWGLFLSTVIWSYGGFDNIGALAGEVKGGRPTFIKGIIGSFPLIFMNYFWPIFVGYSIDTRYQDWTSGFFTVLAYKLHDWLGIWMVVASGVSNFGQFNAGFAPLARGIWAMARAEGTAQKLPRILGWSWRRYTGTVRPIAAILFTGVVTLGITALPFNILVQIFLMIRIVNLICEYAALIKLRYSHPDVPREFAVPGGIVVAWLLGVPTVLLAAFSLYNSDWEVWVAGAVVNAVTLIGYGLKLLYERFCKTSNAGYTSIQ